MSTYIGDLSSYIAATSGYGTTDTSKTSDSSNLDMTDFLTLMVAQFTNQSIDQTADTSDMLNQLVQMSVVEAITNITDAATMMYTSSLVGKEVTIGYYDGEQLVEEVGIVTGTGVSGGEQVVFVNNETYYLNQIMAVGRLPELITEGEGSTGETGEEPGQEPEVEAPEQV